MISAVIPPPAASHWLQVPGRPRLLLVDDQPTNIQALYQVFQADHEVFMATGGPQALEFCRHTPPDLILLDAVMPGMNGMEVCRRLKADPATADIPVVFVTARSDADAETRALEAGAVDFIAKPFNPAVVRARVKIHLTLKAQNDLLRSLAFIDGLTGVANRRRFEETLRDEWRRCRRNRIPLALLMVDVDVFKRYNDRYGHQAGDACLQTIAATMKASFRRAGDLVARYGGEEFACLMVGADPAAAGAKAEGLRAAIAALAIPHEDSPVADVVTLSVGVASMVPDDGLVAEELLSAADAALYAAKSGGRNQVCAAPQP